MIIELESSYFHVGIYNILFQPKIILRYVKY